jgi:hypothetical protein
VVLLGAACTDADTSSGALDPVTAACSLPVKLLERIARGHDSAHSEDVTVVPHFPNYSGTATITSHSGPWDYLQRVPLVFYGPYVPARGPLNAAATLADVYPTVGDELAVSMPQRDGRTLHAVLPTGIPPPQLVVVIVWDGVGRNVLDRWPDAWPTLARLEEEGVSYSEAVVGSSPSITPATHSTLGTGAFPRRHGVTAIEYRTGDGTVRTSFAQRDPSDLELATFGDRVDRYFRNRSLVGMLASKSWHLGMMGHGSAISGGDKDQLGLITVNGAITGNDDFYETPSYLKHGGTLEDRATQLDRADGEVDGEWMGHDILGDDDNPAWADFQTDRLLELFRREGYGRDDVPDLFFTNYKMTDIVGHQYNMDSPEMEATLAAQDRSLGRIVDHLERKVDNYVVIVTADHGHTPSAERTGAWPISNRELESDLDEHFDVPAGESLVLANSAVGPFLDRDVMSVLDVTDDDVATFLATYTIEDNAPDGVPTPYEDRATERVFDAAFPANDIDGLLACASDRADT